MVHQEIIIQFYRLFDGNDLMKNPMYEYDAFPTKGAKTQSKSWLSQWSFWVKLYFGFMFKKCQD